MSYIISNPVTVTTQPVVSVAPVGIYPLALDYDIMNDSSYLAQEQIINYFRFRTLDHWLYHDLAYLLKYLKGDVNKITPVSSRQEYESNKVESDSSKLVEVKADWIGDNILTFKAMRDILKRIMYEMGYKWYELTYHEHLVRDVTEKYIRKAFRRTFVPDFSKK